MLTMHVLVTGAAGFIGYHLSEALVAQGARVTGVDNLNDYYEVSLKEARLKNLQAKTNFAFLKLDIADRSAMLSLAGKHSDITHIAHLAAQAGVRHSLTDPYTYVMSNVMGQVVMLELRASPLRFAVSLLRVGRPSTAPIRNLRSPAETRPASQIL